MSDEPKEKNRPFRDADFSHFLLGLATSALIELGAMAHPGTGKTSVNIEEARYIIDILGMLEEKTKGNLSPQEESHLKEILFNLRMTFVNVQKAQQGG